MTTERASNWSVTINNPTANDEDCINLARQAGWSIVGQLERGENGTQHYQLYVKTPQVRFSALKKRFPRAHIEVARTPAALARYVVKEETRAAALPEQQDKYPSLSKFWDLVFDYLNGLGKDGLDYVELEADVVCMYRPEIDKAFKKNPLHFLDEAAGFLITHGYHVESLAANPSTRSMWKLFHKDIIIRSFHKKQNDDREHNQNADDDQTSHRSGSEEELPEYRGYEGSQASSIETRSQGSDSSSQGSHEA